MLGDGIDKEPSTRDIVVLRDAVDKLGNRFEGRVCSLDKAVDKRIGLLDSDICDYTEYSAGVFAGIHKDIATANRESLGMFVGNRKSANKKIAKLRETLQQIADIEEIRHGNIGVRLAAIEHELSKTPFTKFKERHPILFKKVF